MPWEASSPVSVTATDDWAYENFRRLEEALREGLPLTAPQIAALLELLPGLELQKDGASVVAKTTSLNITGTATLTKTGDNSADLHIEGGGGVAPVNEFTTITGRGQVIDDGIVASDVLTDAEGRKYYLVIAPKSLRSRQRMGLSGLNTRIPEYKDEVDGPSMSRDDGRLNTARLSKPPFSTYDDSADAPPYQVHKTNGPDGLPLVGGPYVWAPAIGSPAIREVERISALTNKPWYIPAANELGIALNDWEMLDSVDTTVGDITFAKVYETYEYVYVDAAILTARLNEGSAPPMYNRRYLSVDTVSVTKPSDNSRKAVLGSGGWAEYDTSARAANSILVAVRRIYEPAIAEKVGGSIDLGNGRYMKVGRHVVPALGSLTVSYPGRPLTEVWGAQATALNSINVPNMPSPTCDPFLETITLYNNFEYDAVTVSYEVVGEGTGV